LETRTNTNTVIAVDLDGTLTLTDTLHESALCLLRDSPLNVLALPFWLLGGKAALKAKVADRVDLDVSTLPYNGALIDWLKEERAAGCVFHPRCSYVTPRCMSESPVRRKIGSRIVACHAIEEGRI